MTGKSLSGHLKDKLIQQALEHKLKQIEQTPLGFNPLAKHTDIPDAWCRFEQLAGYKQIQIIYKGGAQLGVGNPFFRLHEGIAGATTDIGGQTYINYASYNYLGLSGDPRVSQAAKEAIDQYGTSVS
ncbi:MAG: 8-amino-7-oxononanoate synthase, partial [Methylovulum sp.]|nr:8-amino-7-oxononanoate synthase [Methylovulum sp.]